MEPNSYTVKTNEFEGPLELLLELIEKRKLFINDISLSKVSQDFIEYIEKIDYFPLETSAHFVLIASTLLLIKSKSLLPTLVLNQEEEHSIEELENRLKKYKNIKRLASSISKQFGTSIIWQRLKTTRKPVFSPTSELTVSNLEQSIKKVVTSLPKIEKSQKAIVRKVISLEEMIQKLSKRIQSGFHLSFKTITSQIKSKEEKTQKIEIIVTFLAMLELVKIGIVYVSQEKQFEDIHINKNTVTVPDYN